MPSAAPDRSRATRGGSPGPEPRDRSTFSPESSCASRSARASASKPSVSLRYPVPPGERHHKLRRSPTGDRRRICHRACKSRSSFRPGFHRADTSRQKPGSLRRHGMIRLTRARRTSVPPGTRFPSSGNNLDQRRVLPKRGDPPRLA